MFGIAAVATLLAGVFLERSGEALAGRVGLSGVLFGSTVLATATSLPEVSTGRRDASGGQQAGRMEDDRCILA